MNEPQWTYQDIVNHFVKIIGNGTFTVETINESILLKMLDSKGIKIPVEKSYRDIDKDYKMHLQDIGITMNEPQLSAEQYKKYATRFCNCNEGQFSKMATHSQSCDFIQGSFVDHQEQMHFLATALEEQEEKHRERRTKWAFKTVGEVEEARADERAKILGEVEEWAESKMIVNTTGGFGHHMHNSLLVELRTKLNQLKGE